MHAGLSKKAPNYPKKPKMNLTSSIQFPTDLIAEGRNFYSEFIFMDYSVSQQLTSTPILRPVDGKYGSVWLPLPRKINDVQTINWGEFSGMGAFTSIAGEQIKSNYNSRAGAQGAANAPYRVNSIGQAGLLGAGASVATGLQLNPAIFMQFNSPNLKEHTLSWTLAPASEAESRALKSIIDKFRYYSLPKVNGLGGGAILEYPSILFVKIYPEEDFTMKFRPCAVLNVSVDFTGGGGPSFFSQGAPTIVNLTLQLKEIQMWDKTNYDGGEGVTVSESIGQIANTVTTAVGGFQSTARDFLSRLGLR